MFWTEMEWWKNWAGPRVPCDLDPSWLLHNCYTNREESVLMWKKEITSAVVSFKPTCFSYHLLYLIFSFLPFLSPSPSLNWPLPVYVCLFSSGIMSNNKHKSNWWRVFSTSACLFPVSVSTTRWIRSQIPTHKAERGCRYLPGYYFQLSSCRNTLSAPFWCVQ